LRTLDLLVGMPLILLDARARRFGDRLAGTVVIHEPERGGMLDPVVRLPDGWGEREVEVVEALLERLETLDPEPAARLCQRVLRLAERDDAAFLVGLPRTADAAGLLVAAFAGSPRPPAVPAPPAPEPTPP
jgi:hypothetical protein